MARKQQWAFQPGETRDLGASMTSELDSTAVLTGNTPTVSAWTRAGNSRTGYAYTAAAGFTFANEQTNVSAATADSGETIAIGKGIFFRCTAPTTQGTYFIRSECTADDGTHVVREDELVVEGAPAP